MPSVKQHLWRALVRVIYVHPVDGVFAVVPAWESQLAILIKWDNIAPELYDGMKPGYYYGTACLGADDWEDLALFIGEKGSSNTSLPRTELAPEIFADDEIIYNKVL